MENPETIQKMAYEEEPDTDSADASFDDTPKQVDPTKVAKVTQLFNENGTMRRVIKARKSAFVHNIIHLDGAKFDFTGREYLLPLYDRNDSRILLKTSRQVEKCGVISTTCVLSSGEERRIDELRPGDKITAESDGRQVVDTVVASETNGNRPCVRVRTRLGAKLEVTLNHPLKKLQGWVVAGELKVGDKIAALRTVGQFGEVAEPLAGLLGLMVGDGSMTDNWCRFTCKTPEVQTWFGGLYGECNYNVDSRSGTRNYYVGLSSPIIKYAKEHGVFGKTASFKELPVACFKYDKTSTRELLRGLWATDGHCKNVTSSKVDLVYCSTSPVLARQIRMLLRKFGIVTVMRENRPNNNGRLAYIVRVVTRKSLEAFHREIGPIPGKPFLIPDTVSNSNLDTLPKEIHDLILEARKKNGSYWTRDSLAKRGLVQNRAYCPTYEKVAKIQKTTRCAQIQKILESDIIWDEITSIEDIGEQPTWGIQTGTQTYISDFIVNHNTTSLANHLIIKSVVQPYNKSLYVSPSHTQTRQFSSEKLKPAIERSPFIMRYLQDSQVSSQVFEKGFTNGSFIFLRSAFRSADRARGISARDLCIDEIQDFLGSEIPVIRECTSHFHDSTEIMAGTPKSFDNPIEIYWQETTQNEWLVPCSCRKWNFLDEQCIAPTVEYTSGRLPPGPICKKCNKPLNVRAGRWTSTSAGKDIQGYRIPQLMVPWIVGTDKQWHKLLWKRDNYPFGQLSNEVLGLSYDSASKPITRDELIACCQPYDLWDADHLTEAIVQEARRSILVAGVDWGEGNDGSEKSPSGKIRNASYTVLTIGTYINQKQWAVKLMKRYTGREVEPDHVVADICRIMGVLNVPLVGVDWGHGWGVNNTLVRRLGPQRVIQFQYLPKLKQRLKWDPLGFRYHLQRNFMMSEFFYDMKNGLVVFPRWQHIETFAKDILAIYAEYVEYRREIKYDHRPSDPDDAFHSMHYAKLAADIHMGKSRRYTIRED
jgi:intein/homing endonuclease